MLLLRFESKHFNFVKQKPEIDEYVYLKERERE